MINDLTIKRMVKRWRHIIGSAISSNPTVVSYPKCGRTWLANVLINYIAYHSNPNAAQNDFAIRPNFNTVVKGTSFPKISFSHDVYSVKLPIAKWPKWSMSRFAHGRKLLLLRDPRAILVSLYYHVLGRRHKIELPEDITLQAFIKTYDLGLPGLGAFVNIWATNLNAHGQQIKVMHYEDFLGGWDVAQKTWIEFTEHITAKTVEAETLRKAVEDNEISRLKKKIQQGKLSSNLASLGGRVRKGKAKGYLEELSEDDIREIDDRLLKTLCPKATKLMERYFDLRGVE